MKNNNNKGFTLVELLAVVIILGILLVIGIPAVEKIIYSTRKNIYITKAEDYITAVRRNVMEERYALDDKDTTYYIPGKCVADEVEKSENSPFGKFEDIYIAVAYNGKDYDYYWTGRDSQNMGIKLTHEDKLDKKYVKSNIKEIKLETGVGGRKKIVVLENCDYNGIKKEDAKIKVVDKESIADKGSIIYPFTEKANEAYAKTYVSEMYALARNPSITIQTTKYRKYFDNLRVKPNEAFLKIHADATASYMFSDARNPSLRNDFNNIMDKLTYKGNIPPESYTPAVQGEYMNTTGLFLQSYARNPSLVYHFVESLDKYNPYVETHLNEMEDLHKDMDEKLIANVTYNMNLPEVKAAREKVIGNIALSYSRNPSLYDKFKIQYNKYIPLGKNPNPSPQEQAGAVKAVGQTILGYARNPSLRYALFGQNPIGQSNILETDSSLNINPNLEEVQIARAQTLEVLISAIYRNPSLTEQLVDYYNHYIGLPPTNPSTRVQAINLYNNGLLLQTPSFLYNDKIEKEYDKVAVNITANTEEIQAAYLANLGRLYYAVPSLNDANKERVLNYFRTKLYKKPTSNSPLIQAAKYYSDGFYDSVYNRIMEESDKSKKEKELKLLNEIKEEFSPDIEIDYSLEEVQIAKIEFLNTVYKSIGRGGNCEIIDGPVWMAPLQPSEEYFRNK